MAYGTYEVPCLTKTPWEAERHRRNSVWNRTSHEARLSHRVFKNLPREVYDCILEWLELQHFGNQQYCPSCHLRDLCSLSLTSRAWDRAATIQLYVFLSVPFIFRLSSTIKCRNLPNCHSRMLSCSRSSWMDRASSQS
jgi:hypothetical protein